MKIDKKLYLAIRVLGIFVFISLACTLPILGDRNPISSSSNNIDTSGNGQANGSPPAWIDFGSDCQPQSSSASSGGSPWRLDENGHTVELLEDNQVTCYLEVLICGDRIVKTLVIDQGAGESCPDSFHYSYAPEIQVCCSAWDEAKVSKIPCDPLEDTDCDGIQNQDDDYLLDPQK